MIKRGSTNALLQKASSQLRGEKVKQSEEEDDLNAYIKSLTQKTTQQKKSVNFEDVGEISISSDLDTHSQLSHAQKHTLITSGNKFLKKKRTENTTQPAGKYLKKPQVSNASPIPTVSGQNELTRTNKQKDSFRTSSALSKASALSSKFAKRSAEPRKTFTLETDSSESLHTPRPTSSLGGYIERPQSADSDSFKIGRDGAKFMKKKPQETEIKIKASPKASPKSSPKVSKKTPKKEQKASSVKYSSDLVLSSGEESLAEFVAGLDSSDSFGERISKHKRHKNVIKRRTPSPVSQRTPSPDSKPPTARRSPSPGPRQSPTPRRSPNLYHSRSRSSSGESDIMEIKDNRYDDSSDDGFKVNLMDVDFLEPVVTTPVSPVTKKKKKSSQKSPSPNQQSSPFKSQKEQSSPFKSQKQQSSPFKSQKEQSSPFKSQKQQSSPFKSQKQQSSPFKSQKEQSSPFKSQKQQSSPFKSQKQPDDKKKSESSDLFLGLQTVEDLLGHSFDDRPASVASVESKSESQEIPEEMDNAHKKKTTSFHSVIESDIKTQEISSVYKRSYSDDFDDTISEKIGESMGRLSRASSRIEDTEGYTQAFTSDSESEETVSQSTESLINSSKRERRSAWEDKENMRNVQVQTSEPGLSYTWDQRFHFQPSFVDPTSIAKYIISPEALESMTSYNPCMLALHDMLRQQLQLTQSFLTAQQSMYKSLSESLDNKYRYTTLEDTKKYIAKHRRKRLSMKEALRLVDMET